MLLVLFVSPVALGAAAGSGGKPAPPNGAAQAKGATAQTLGVEQPPPGAVRRTADAPGEGPSAPAPSGKALRERLDKERARLAELQAELKQVQGGAVSPPPPGTAARLAEAPKPDPQAMAALIERPSLGAADALYRLGRIEEARALYEAVARQPKLGESERTWALLQAGTCARRLSDLDTAIEHYQQILADYPDSPWSKGHVAWALRAAQWGKRWQRLAPDTGD